MKKHLSGSSTPILFLLLAMMGLQTVASWWGFDTKAVFIAQTALFFAMLSLVIWYLVRAHSDLRQAFRDVGVKLGAPGSDALNSFVLPLVILRDDGSILWYNEIFRTRILQGEDLFGVNADEFLTDAVRSTLDITNKADIAIDDRLYTVYQSSYLTESGETCRALYFIDDTNLKTAAAEYTQTRPAIMLIRIDSLDELAANLAESEQASIRSAIEREIEAWATKTSGLTRKLSNADYLLVVEERSLEDIIHNRFDILEKVRALTLHDRRGATLSIGVGRGAPTLQECEQMARQALDMALGRGGDQAVVKCGQKIQYYGGKAQQLEKTTRVKARVKAHALRELLETKDCLLIMGHKIGDIDCFGAAIGMYRIASALNKKAHIVINEVTSSVRPMMERFETGDYPKDLFLTGSEAADIVDNNTALVVVDVNRPSITEEPDLLKLVKTIVVIDHHRQSSEIITNETLSYVEPYASSACELVAEILQYVADSIRIKSPEADAMYAGIVIDTNNFTNQAGVRTFEAAAFLRRNGADVTRVRKLFRDSMEDYKARAEAVRQAEVYKKYFAISVCPAEGVESPTVVGAQAANELLDIVGMKASVVLTPYEGKIYISARSIDEVNVQVMMEKLGGGGHRTIAGAQLPGATVEEAKEKVKGVIDMMLEKGEI